MTTNSFDLGKFRLRLLLAFLVGITSSTAVAEMSTLEEVILDLKEECAGYIQAGTFKGEDVSNYSLDDVAWRSVSPDSRRFPASRNSFDHL